MHQPNEQSSLLGLSPEAHHNHGEHHTHHKFGGQQKIIDAEPDPRGRFCGDLIVLPRLRQKFIKDPITGENVLAREPDERKATWLELFYDLIFVALVSQLTHALAGGPVDILRFSILYLCVWRTWSSTTMYSTRYDTNDLIHKWYYYFQMIAIVGMGIWMHPAYAEPYSVGFAASFLSTRGLNWIMYLLAHLYDSSSGALHNVFSIPIFAIPMIISCFLPDKSYILWPITAFGEEIFNWLRTWAATKLFTNFTVRVPISIEHLTERNGLFVMIVLGECVAGSMFRKSSVGEVIGVNFFVASALGLLIAFSLQWIYFDTEGRPKKTHALRRTITFGLLWGSLHVPLVGFIMVGASGLLVCMEHMSESDTPAAPTSVHLPIFSSITSDEHTFPLSARWLMSVGFGCATLIAALLQAVSEEHPLRIKRRISVPIRLVASILTILLPLFAPESFDALRFLAVVSSLVFFGAICSLLGGMRKPDHGFQGLNINSALSGMLK